MRALLMLVGMILSLGACSKDVQLVNTNGTTEPVVYEDQATVEVRLSDSDLLRYSSDEDAMWQEARKLGLNEVFFKLLRRDIMFAPVQGGGFLDAHAGTYVQNGQITQYRDAETNDLVQSFHFSARFAGDADLGGEVVTLEDKSYIAGSTDLLYSMLYNKTPVSLPAYAAIAEPMKELGTGMYRLIGFAEVKQTTGNIIRTPAGKSGAQGQLCALEVLLSDREVEAGDMIFLVSVSAQTLDVPTIGKDVDSMVVEPPVKDEVQEPAENK